MLNAFWWLITAEIIGLAAFPIAYFLLPRLSDRGYSLSKPLGILFIGYFSWVLSFLHVLPSIRISLIGLLVVMAGISGWYVWRNLDEFKSFVIRERKALLMAEAVFLVFFIGWTIFRSYDPYINHTEQPMDVAFLNASINSTFGQPEDPWLRGETISYYYFGYWMMGSVSQITGIASNVSYNLSLVLIPAMAAMGIFGFVVNMVRTDTVRWGYAVVSGVAAALFMGIVANLEGVLEFMRANGMGSMAFWNWVRIDGLDGPSATLTESWAPSEFWWWFRATRVINTFEGDNGIDYTIQEFPFFSFILGDMHPHVMAIPFVIMFLGLALNFLRSPIMDWRSRDIQGYISIFVLGLALGGLGFLNMWEMPTYAVLFLGVATLKAYHEHDGRIESLIKYAAPVGIVVVALAFVLYSPYLLSFRAGISGIGAVPVTTRAVHMFIIWGLFLVAVTPFILATFWQTKVSADWRRLATYGLLIGFLPWLVWVYLNLQNEETTGGAFSRLFHILPFGLLIAIAVYNVAWLIKNEGVSGRLYAMLLSILGLMLIMGPELLFIRDFFGSRMNTVFKLYYQSWILLAVASGYAIYYWHTLRINLSGWRRSLSTLWAAAFIFLLAGSLYYPPAAASTKGELNDPDTTLNGTAFARSAEQNAIEFLKREVPPDSAIVEAVGEWFDWGLISRNTGIPTIFNWPGHEIQWRGSDEKFAGREDDVARIYQSIDVNAVKNLLAKYDVEYVYVGHREREKYGDGGIEKFDTFMDTVFSQDDVIIYRVRE